MKNRLKRTIPFFLLPAVILLLLSPLEIYTSNQTEFAFSLQHFFWIFLGCAVIFVALGSFVISLLPEKLGNILLSILFSVTLMAYLQNMFLNKELSTSDGSSMDWSVYHNYTIVNGILWVLVCGILIFLGIRFAKTVKIYGYAAIFLTCVQMVTVVVLLVQCISSPSKAEDNHSVFAGKYQMQYAAENNIIVLILDHTSSDEFDTYYSEHPEEVESYLSDFTYYNNADSHYNFTFPSLVHMLTGTEADNSMTLTEWCDTAWSSERSQEFYQQLHAAGYTCNMYSEKNSYATLGSISNLDGSFDNIVEDTPKINYGLICRLLEKMTVYRYCPYVLKPRFEMRSNAFADTYVYSYEQGEIAYDNPDYYSALMNQGLSTNSDFEKLFDVIHIQGLHGPYVTGTNGELVEETDLEITMQGLSLIVNEYLSQLKEIGVYDNAAIFIISDHGEELGGGPQPIYFVKLPGETHKEIQVNSAPISHDDFQATILDLIGADYSDYGTTIFDWEPGDTRERELWYPDHGYYIYRYSTDREELKQKIEDEDYEKVDSLLMDQWRLMDINGEG